MRISFAAAIMAALLLTGCAGVQVGGGSGSSAQGSAGPAGVQNASIELHHCAVPVATVAIKTDQQQMMLIAYGLPGDPLPALRLIAQQSGCFRIVNRDAGLQAGEQERALAARGELRKGANFGSGQIIPADYTVSVEVLVNNPNAGGFGGGTAMLGMIPYVGGFAALAAASVHYHEAQVLLSLYDNHTTEQVGTATGKASGTSFNLGGGLGGIGIGVAGLGGAGGYENTDQGKVVIGAMVDALNQMTPQVSQLRSKR